MVSAASNRRKSIPIRILHVDDDDAFLEISKMLLFEQEKDLIIDHATSVSQAFSLLTETDYDLVLSDYEMPETDGLSFLKELRTRGESVPFVLFTGHGKEEIVIKALNMGVDGYHNKSDSPNILYKEIICNIRKAVEKRKLEKDLIAQKSIFAKISAQIPGMVYQFMRRPEGTFCVPYSSDYIKNIFGCSPIDVLEDFSPITKLIVPEDLGKVFLSIEQSAANLSPWECEYRIQVSGKIRWLWGHSVPEKLDDGSILWNGFNMDITERKDAEE